MSRFDPNNLISQESGMTLQSFENITEVSESNFEDSITVCLCTVQKMYSAGSIDEQQRD